MLAITQSAVLSGIASHPVRVEVQAERGIPIFELVGLPEAAVRESRVRVKSALAGVGVDISECRVTVNLAPADLKKSGSAFDLAIALGTLVALGVLKDEDVKDVLFLGELSLNGGMQSLRGAVAHLLGARERRVSRVILPIANEHEAALVAEANDESANAPILELAETLAEVIESIRRRTALRRPIGLPQKFAAIVDDLRDVRGQFAARRALEIAASGGHNLLMIGPPGSGKTMLARRLPGILPPMSREEALEVTAIHGVAGLLRGMSEIVERPFRAPHHTASDVALVGGGDWPRPGEVSLAHHGVLFLDELSELRRTALEALRQPLEDGAVTICRMRQTLTYPSRPMLIAATNPCPCGHRGNGSRCRCHMRDVDAYRRRLSGPLLDRLDFHVVLPPVDVRELQSEQCGEASDVIRARVLSARAIQQERFTRKEVRSRTNAHLTQRDVERVCKLDSAGKRLLRLAVDRRGLSARAYGKVLRVARTLADMEAKTAISASHISEAVSGRVLDRDDSGGVGGRSPSAEVRVA